MLHIYFCPLLACEQISVLPYAKGASEKITTVLNQQNIIKVAHKLFRMVGSLK